MKSNSLISKIKNIQKKTLALLLVPAFALVATGAATIAQTNMMEGEVSGLNVSRGQTTYSDTTAASTGEVVQVKVWFHNRSNPAGEKANNTRVRVSVPTASGANQIVTGTVTSDNMNTVTDTTAINLSDSASTIEYIPGQSRYQYNKGAADGRPECITGFEFPPENCYATVPISDAVVGGGVNLDTIRGKGLTGCNAYHEVVTIQVRVKTPKLQLTKQVKEVGVAGWNKLVSVEPGDKVQFMLGTKNIGTADLTNVAVKDAMPAHLQYIEGTTQLYDQYGTKTLGEGLLFGNGVALGTYKSGGARYVLFQARVLGDFEGCEVRVRNKAIANADQVPGGIRDEADVKITKPDCGEPEPVALCDELTLTQVEGSKFRVKTDVTAKDGATVKQYRYNFGDGSDVLLTSNDTVEHTFPSDGTFVVRVSVDFEIDGQVVTKTGEKCKATLRLEKKQPMCPVPGKEDLPADSDECYEPCPHNPNLPIDSKDCKEVPVVLPNTGAGDILAIFIAVTVAGTLAYRFVLAPARQ